MAPYPPWPGPWSAGGASELDLQRHPRQRRGQRAKGGGHLGGAAGEGHAGGSRGHAAGGIWYYIYLYIYMCLFYRKNI